MYNTFNDKILKSILNKLQGYITLSEQESDELTDLDYDNVISIDEVKSFWYSALLQSLNYCYELDYPKEEIIDEDDDEIYYVMERSFEEGVILWTSGLIWRKYNIRQTDNIEESGYSISYGDQLIIDAKKQLDPYRRTIFAIW